MIEKRKKQRKKIKEGSVFHLLNLQIIPIYWTGAMGNDTPAFWYQYDAFWSDIWDKIGTVLSHLLDEHDESMIHLKMFKTTKIWYDKWYS